MDLGDRAGAITTPRGRAAIELEAPSKLRGANSCSVGCKTGIDVPVTAGTVASAVPTLALAIGAASPMVALKEVTMPLLSKFTPVNAMRAKPTILFVPPKIGLSLITGKM